MKPTTQQTRTLCFVLALAGTLVGCHNEMGTVFQRRMEARRLTADLRMEFNKAAGATNRAVMADTDEESIAFADEAKQAKQAVGHDVGALGPLLRGLDYGAELALLADFERCYGQYQTLDQTILELAVENSNLKAQRLAFGAGREAAAEFHKALAAIKDAAPAKQKCQVSSLADGALIALLELEVRLPPHIAESDDAMMTRMEQGMAEQEATARGALTTISGLIQPASQAELAKATAALDRFHAVQAQIIALSRRNSNVRSLALALGPARKLTTACEGNLDALTSAFTKDGDRATR